MFVLSERMLEYLRETGRSSVAKLAEMNRANLVPDEGCVYDRVFDIDLDTLAPHINGPYTPDLCTRVDKLAQRAAEEGWPVEISSALIGSCTNSSYEDMAKCANLTQQALDAGLTYKVPFYVTPGSRAVQVNIEKGTFCISQIQVHCLPIQGPDTFLKTQRRVRGYFRKSGRHGFSQSLWALYRAVETRDASRGEEHDRHVVQPELRQAKRREPGHALFRHVARARHDVGVFGTAGLQPVRGFAANS